jgi:hypothetical protein
VGIDNNYLYDVRSLLISFNLLLHFTVMYLTFFVNARLFLKNAWQLKEEFETFLKILMRFEDIFREIEVFLN